MQIRMRLRWLISTGGRVRIAGKMSIISLLLMCIIVAIMMGDLEAILLDWDSSMEEPLSTI